MIAPSSFNKMNQLRLPNHRLKFRHQPQLRPQHLLLLQSKLLQHKLLQLKLLQLKLLQHKLIQHKPLQHKLLQLKLNQNL